MKDKLKTFLHMIFKAGLAGNVLFKILYCIPYCIGTKILTLIFLDFVRKVCAIFENQNNSLLCNFYEVSAWPSSNKTL